MKSEQELPHKHWQEAGYAKVANLADAGGDYAQVTVEALSGEDRVQITLGDRVRVFAADGNLSRWFPAEVHHPSGHMLDVESAILVRNGRTVYRLDLPREGEGGTSK